MTIVKPSIVHLKIKLSLTFWLVHMTKAFTYQSIFIINSLHFHPLPFLDFSPLESLILGSLHFLRWFLRISASYFNFHFHHFLCQVWAFLHFLFFWHWFHLQSVFPILTSLNPIIPTLLFICHLSWIQSFFGLHQTLFPLDFNFLNSYLNFRPSFHRLSFQCFSSSLIHILSNALTFANFISFHGLSFLDLPYLTYHPTLSKLAPSFHHFSTCSTFSTHLSSNGLSLHNMEGGVKEKCYT